MSKTNITSVCAGGAAFARDAAESETASAAPNTNVMTTLRFTSERHVTGCNPLGLVEIADSL